MELERRLVVQRKVLLACFAEDALALSQGNTWALRCGQLLQIVVLGDGVLFHFLRVKDFMTDFENIAQIY